MLADAGYSVILLERTALGAGQTLASQGIIHGGTKYTLGGALTGASEAVREMPTRWQEHLQGRRFPRLDSVSLASDVQWMWASGGLTAKLAGLLASKAMNSRVGLVDPGLLPGFFHSRKVYELQEPVLDTASLLQALADQGRAELCRASVARISVMQHGLEVELDDPATTLKARLVINSAGGGNERLSPRAMQRRTLHMVMVKGDLPRLYGHAIEAGSNPRLTITSHVAGEDMVWYLGGQLAETGTSRSSLQQVQSASRELKALFPDIDQHGLEWATLLIDRAEGQQAGGKRPDLPVIHEDGPVLTLWPTKLAFVPRVGDHALEYVQRSISPQVPVNLPDSMKQDHVAVGLTPWQQASWVRIDD